MESEKLVDAIKAATKCCIVGQAMLVGHCAGNSQCGWVVGQSVGHPLQVGEAVALQLGIRLQILARPIAHRSHALISGGRPMQHSCCCN